ncbi:MAG: N(5)-(carboxyethyl)ornithine synthase [Phycisphaerae bacterium]
MAKVGFPIPRKENELRRALAPEDVRRLNRPGDMLVETGYGAPMGCDDKAYREAGAQVVNREEVVACSVICCPKPMLTDEYFQTGRTLFGWMHAVQGREITDLLVKHRMTAIAWEDMFKRGRHCFWRNNELSGEAAVAHAMLKWGRVPYHAQAAVIGRGNVARGATRALERMGCLVTVYDRKTSPLLREEIEQYDVVVNGVLWDVFRTDHLVYIEDLRRMKPGSLIIDISCDEGMGVESSRPTTIDDPVYVRDGVLHYCVDHAPALYHRTATQSISEVVAEYADDLAGGRVNPVLEQATVIREGQIVDERIVRFQHR